MVHRIGPSGLQGGIDSAPLDADVDGLKCGERTRLVVTKTAPSVGIFIPPLLGSPPCRVSAPHQERDLVSRVETHSGRPVSMVEAVQWHSQNVLRHRPKFEEVGSD